MYFGRFRRASFIVLFEVDSCLRDFHTNTRLSHDILAKIPKVAYGSGSENRVFHKTGCCGACTLLFLRLPPASLPILVHSPGIHFITSLPPSSRAHTLVWEHGRSWDSRNLVLGDEQGKETSSVTNNHNHLVWKQARSYTRALSWSWWNRPLLETRANSATARGHNALAAVPPYLLGPPTSGSAPDSCPLTFTCHHPSDERSRRTQQEAHRSRAVGSLVHPHPQCPGTDCV
jgi:hypothetical protein